MASNGQLSPSLQLWVWDTALWLRVQPFSWYRCPGWLLTDWNKLNGNPKNSTKCCSERPGRKLEAHQPYSFVGRDGSPQGRLQVLTVSGIPVKAMLKISLVYRKEFTSKHAAGLSQRNALPTTASFWVILLKDLSVLKVNMCTNIGSTICARENKGKNLLVSYSSWVNLWVLPPSWVAVSYNIVQSAASLNNSCWNSRHWAHHWNPIKLLSFQPRILKSWISGRKQWPGVLQDNSPGPELELDILQSFQFHCQSYSLELPVPLFQLLTHRSELK